MIRVDKDVFWFCTVKSDIRDIDKSEFAEINMKIWKNKTWQWETTGTEKTSVLFGKQIFSTDFRATNETVEYKDRKYDVYTVFIDGDEKTFAMTEVSNGVYEFLLYRY